MNVEIGKMYRNKGTGEEYTATNSIIFNIMVELERGGETFYCNYKDFILNFEKVS